jgi:two-component system chemotaxis response regulator CheY
MRALVVDDSRIMRLVIRGHLKNAGFKEADISEAGHGEEALAQMGTHRPALVLSDVNMPVMNGEQLLTELARRGWLGEGRVVMVTSRYERHLFRRLLHRGAATIVRKPFTPDRFLRQIEPVLQDLADYLGESRTPLAAVPMAPEVESEVLRDPISLVTGQDPADAVVESASFVLQGLGLHPVAATEAVPPKRLYFADVDIDHPQVRGVALYADAALCEGLSFRMTGIGVDADETRADVVGEIANMLVGRMVSALWPGQEPSFNTPHTGTIGASEVVWSGLGALSVPGAGTLWVGLLR